MRFLLHQSSTCTVVFFFENLLGEFLFFSLFSLFFVLLISFVFSHFSFSSFRSSPLSPSFPFLPFFLSFLFSVSFLPLSFLLFPLFSLPSSWLPCFPEGCFCQSMLAFFLRKLGDIDATHLVTSVLRDCRFGFIRYTLFYFQQYKEFFRE